MQAIAFTHQPNGMCQLLAQGTLADLGITPETDPNAAFEALNRYLNACFMGFFEDACRAERVILLSESPEMELLRWDAEGFSLRADFVELPAGLAAPGTEGLVLPAHPEPVTEEAVDTLARWEKERVPRYHPVQREARSGDSVMLFYECRVDGTIPQSGSAHSARVSLGKGQTLPALEQAILGKRAGERFTAAFTLPADYADRALAGHPAVFDCRLDAVEQEELPADEEMAVAQGLTDAAAWREKLRGDLATRRRLRARAANREELLIQLGLRMEQDAPQPLAEQELREQQAAVKSEGGLPVEQALRERSRLLARGVMGLYALARDNDLFPSAEELAAAVARYASLRKIPLEEYRSSVGEHVAWQLLTRKRALDWLESRAAAE